MAAIHSILVATDLSERAAPAEDRAAMLVAEHRSSALEMVTVEEVGRLDMLAQLLRSTVEATLASVSERAAEALQSRAERLKNVYGVASTCAVRIGYPAAEITARADETAADLIAIGAHGGSFLSDIFLGDTADKLVHLCKKPLLIVKNKPQQAYRRVLVPVDFSADARRAAELALKLAPEADLTLLHAFEVWFEGRLQYANVSQEVIDNFRIEAREKARHELNRFAAGLDAGDRYLDQVIVFGRPEKIVREYAENHSPDLIVMGKHGSSRLADMIIGSVTRDTVDQTDCDILIVPTVAEAG